MLHPSVSKKYFQPLKNKGVEVLGKDLATLTAAKLETIKEGVQRRQHKESTWRACSSCWRTVRDMVLSRHSSITTS